MRALSYLLTASVILPVVFQFGCHSDKAAPGIAYKKGDFWVEHFHNADFPAKAFFKKKIYCSSLEISSGKPNFFYCFDLATGKVDWASPVEDCAAEPPVITDSFIYYCSYVGDIYKFDSEGNQVWKSKLQGAYAGHSLDMANNNLLVATVANGIFEYDIRSGEIVSHNGANTIGVPLPVFDKDVYLFAGLNFGEAAAPRGAGAISKSLHGDQEIWKKDIGEIAGDKIFSHAGRFYFFDSSGTLNCWDISTGTPIWTSDPPNRDIAHANTINAHMIFIKGEIIYYDSDLGKMTDLDSGSGKILSVATYHQLLAEHKLTVQKSQYELVAPDSRARFDVMVTDSLETPDDYARTFTIAIRKETGSK